ncbi:MAG: FkbM family methyltransferase [Candidatus Bathyarchaeia archaeon]|jgi:FkbM family methyltransferase
MDIHLIDDFAPYFATVNPARKLFCSQRFGRVGFWCRHHEDFVVQWGKCTLKDLNLDFSLRHFPYSALDMLYFPNRENYVFRNVNGKICMDIEDRVFHIPFPHGIYELLEVYRDQCYRHIKASGTVVDVGAFIGDTAVYFASQGAKRVVAFEPVCQLYQYAIDNVKLNHLENTVEVHNCGVGIKKGEAKFFCNPNHPGGSSLDDRGFEAVIQNVVVVSLADVIRDIGNVELLKLDCEGAEHQLLPHLHETGVISQVQNVILEVHGSKQPILGILKRDGYKIVHVDETETELSLVFASRNPSSHN